MGITTTRQIEALKPRTNRYDVAVHSEGPDGRRLAGLQVRVFPTGARQFVFRYPSPLTGKVRRMTLGASDAIGLAEARKLHFGAWKQLEAKIDPQDAAQAQVEAARVERARKAAEITVAQLVDEFITEYLREHRKDPGQAERYLRTEVVPKWGQRKAKELTRRDAVELVRAVRKRAPVSANRLAALIVQLFGFATDEGHLELNPMAGLKRPTRETPRDRKLDVDEIRTLWRELDARSSSQHGGPLKKGRENQRGTRAAPQLTRPLVLAMKLLLVTGQRRGELLGAAWREFDLQAKLWTIPKSRTKNGREHVVPLSALALELLREIKALSKDSRYLFPARGEDDAPMTEKALTRAAARNQCGLAKWTPHDLRRTAASHMNRLGADAIVVEKVLNHALPRMMETYNRHTFEKEMRAALDQWGAEIRRILAGSSNVVAMPRKRGAA